MTSSKAIVTLLIGNKFIKRWEKLCKKNWEAYAQKHGYDLICIDMPLDSSTIAQSRSPSWQRCLVLKQDFAKKYQQIVWVDSDIVINVASAPCIAQNVPIEKVGAVEVYSAPTVELYTQVLNRQFEFFKYVGGNPILNYTPQDFYGKYGLPPIFDKVVQAGVMVLSPKFHREVLEEAYYNYDDKGTPEWNYEMRPLSWELLKADCVHWIDHRFNLIWADYLCLHYPFLLNSYKGYFAQKLQGLTAKLDAPILASPLRKACINTAFLNSFFLHFAGSSYDMPLVDTRLKSWQEISV